MKYNQYTLLLIGLFLLITGCDDFLDRSPLTVANDETVWTSEDKVRLYANKYYTDFFVGYNSGWNYTGTPLMGFTFSDDIVHNGSQGNFTRSVPNSQVWSMSLIRSINIMIDRVENRMQDILSTEAYITGWVWDASSGRWNMQILLLHMVMSPITITW